MKYTKEILEQAVLKSFSVAEVVRRLGMKCPNGGTHAHVSRRIRKFNIDSSHFLGKGRNRGFEHVGGPDKLEWQSVLVENRNERKESTPRLRRAMIESGIDHRCATCGLDSTWNGKQLVLQISHKDGNSLNNRRSNLHFQCPNCHSQTDDYAGRSARKKSLSPIGGTGETRKS